MNPAKKGFTFIELIVVIFVYSLLLAGTIDIFVLSQRAQRKVAALEKLQDDARFLIQTITQSFQRNGLDYACYQQIGTVQLCGTSLDSANGVNILAIKNFEGKTVLFKHSEIEGECGDARSTPCLLISDNDASSWARGSSDGVKIDTLRFYISPDQNPFQLDENNDYASSQQPRLTVVFGGSAVIKGFREIANVFMQTTISSREYKR